jgi:hypothetical protein
LLLANGWIVFTDVPFGDDWVFVERLKAFLEGETGWFYFFEPHNGHPMLIDRLAFYASWKFTSLNLAMLRWSMALLMLIAGGVLSWQLFCDLRQASGWSSAKALFLVLPIFALAVSLNQWEMFNVAANVGPIATALFAVLSVFLLDRWLASKKSLLLTVALLLAVLASLNGLQGILVWPAMGVILLLNPEGRRSSAVMSIVLLAFFIFAGINFGNVGDRSSFVFDPTSLLFGNLIIAGTPYLTHINDTPNVTAAMIFGYFVWILTGLAMWLYLMSAPDIRIRMNKYVALIAFGFGIALAIEIARIRLFSFEYLAASRYGAQVAPWAWGLWGVLALSSPSNKIATIACSTHAILISIGVGISNIEEADRAIYVRRNFDRQIDALRDGKVFSDKVEMSKIFFMDGQFVHRIPPVREYLLRNKLSLFRGS